MITKYHVWVVKYLLDIIQPKNEVKNEEAMCKVATPLGISTLPMRNP